MQDLNVSKYSNNDSKNESQKITLSNDLQNQTVQVPRKSIDMNSFMNKIKKSGKPKAEKPKGLIPNLGEKLQLFDKRLRRKKSILNQDSSINIDTGFRNDSHIQASESDTIDKPFEVDACYKVESNNYDLKY